MLGSLQRRGEFTPGEGATLESTAEQFAIQIERAVHDAHATSKEYGAQIRTLRFNLKENHELCARLVHGSLVPPMLATMSSDQLASRELQQKTAKMRAQAERQSILETEDAGAPRLRRTHKGEEVVERTNSIAGIVEDKPSVLRRPAAREAASGESGSRRATLQGRGANLRVETKSESTGKKNFDLKRVFNSVRSPTAGAASAHARRPSQAHLPPDGPGHDPDVDRMLQDDDENESPPYSPTEDFWEEDPDVVWRGEIDMVSVGGFQATARHVGGVNLNATIGLPWTTLLPKKLTVAGRIDEKLATEYLCSLRYSAPTDISVASLSPGTEAAKSDFLALIDYFTQRHRYGVIGEKSADNVRDTYLVPIPAGTSTHPEFMLNLEDNFIPTSRTAPMLLLVVVYRNDPAEMERLMGPNWAAQHPAPGVDTPGGAGNANGTSTSAGAAATAAQRNASLERTPSQATPAATNGNRHGTANGNALASGPRNTSIPTPTATGISPIVPHGQQLPGPAAAAAGAPPVTAPPAATAQAHAQRLSPSQPKSPLAPAPPAATPHPQQQLTPPAVQPPQPLSSHQLQPSQVLQPPQPFASRPVPPPLLPQQQQQQQQQMQMQMQLQHKPPPQQIQPAQPHLKVAATPPPLMHPQPIPPVPVAAVNVAAHQHQQQQQHQHQQHQQKMQQLQLQQHQQQLQQQQVLQHQHLMQQQHLQHQQQHVPPGSNLAAAQREQAQRDGEAIAREILGPLATCSAAGYLMTQAAKMQRNEWLLVRSVFEQQPQTRDDLQLLKHELERYNDRHVHPQHAQHQAHQQAQQHAQQHAQHHAAQQHLASPAPAPPKPHVQTPVPIPRVPMPPAAAAVTPMPSAGTPAQRAAVHPITHPAAGAATPGSKPVSR